MDKTRNKALLAALLGNSIFGFSFLFSKIALDITTPSVLVAVRFVVALFVLGLVIIIGKKIKNNEGRPLIEFSLKGKPKKYLILLAIFQPVIYFLAESYGIKYTSSAFAGTIIAVIPLMGVVLDVLIMHIHVTKKQIFCAIGSVIGVAVTTLGAENMKSSWVGVIMLLLAVCAGSFFYVFSKKASEHYNAIERTYAMFVIASVVFVGFALVECKGEYAAIVEHVLKEGAFWGAILYLAVFSSVAAFVILNYASTYISVSEASIFANLTTVISIIAGVVILKESFTIQQVIGAVIIIVSVYISSKTNTNE